MSAVSCPRCGGDVSIPEVESGPSVSLICPSCASRVELTVSADGAETLFQPQLLTAEGEPASAPPSIDPSATVSLGSGTALLDTVADSAEQAVPLATVVQAFLIIVGAEPGSERLALSERATTVGRQSADIVIPDPAMSSRHFEIEIRGSEYFVRDLGSSNGTFLNGDRIRAAELVSGDSIGAGQTTLTFRTFEAIAL